MWGTIVSILYALIVLVLLVPATVVLGAGEVANSYKSPLVWFLAGVPIVSQVILLLLRAETARKRLKPQVPILVSAIITGLLLTFVTFLTVSAIIVAIPGQTRVSDLVLVLPLISWIAWGVAFYGLNQDSTDPVTGALKWLFRGSVLELLVAVPAHVIVRRRNECCAPILTGFGITCGIAIMLLSFGPTVLLLFQKRMNSYSRPSIHNRVK